MHGFKREVRSCLQGDEPKTEQTREESRVLAVEGSCPTVLPFAVPTSQLAVPAWTLESAAYLLLTACLRARAGGPRLLRQGLSSSQLRHWGSVTRRATRRNAAGLACYCCLLLWERATPERASTTMPGTLTWQLQRLLLNWQRSLACLPPADLDAAGGSEQWQGSCRGHC